MEEEEAYDNLNPKLTSNKRPKRLTKLETIRNFLRSEKFHTIVVILVVIDCLCVTVELTLEHIENYVLKHDQKQHDHHRLNFYFHLAEGILQYTCLTILALFVVEVLIKLAFIPRVFISSKWEILDALVVVISFGINIYLLNNKHVVMSIGGLLTLLRLWRITEIVNGNLDLKSFFFNFNLIFFYKTIKL